MYIYIGIPVGISIPLGSGLSKYTKTLATFIKPLHPLKEQLTLSAVEITDLNRTPYKKYWINTPDSLKYFIDVNSIDSSTFPLMLPLQVREYSLLAGSRVWSHKGTRTIGSDKLAVAKTVAMARNIKTRPFIFSTIVCGLTSIMMLVDAPNADQLS